MTKSFAASIMFLLLSTGFALAQTGVIRGTIFDAASGETLIGVTVMVEGQTTGTVTDLDGKFELKLAPGVYNLQISYVSYASITIRDTKVEANQVTLLENIRLSESVEELQEVTISAESINTTEESLLTVKRKSANLVDGISAASFRKMGDSDAAAAVKRVPGVSIEGGKYVYVRGLGDRYTKSTLNGVDVPGLDPDRNTIQMDLFPTSLIDNIVVLKSFTSDLPGDFTGGIVNIDTKDFPDERILNFSASLGYNPSMHLNGEYLTYKGGKTDFLGMDDGTREIPTNRSLQIPLYSDVVSNVDSEEGRQYRSIIEGFNPTLAAMRERSFMDYGFGLNAGNQFVVANNKVGFNFALVYSNTTEYYEEAVFGRYGKSNPSINKLQVREYQVGDYGVNNATVSGIAGVAFKTDHSKFKLNLFHSQSGESRAGIFDYVGSDLGSNFNAFQHNLEFTQRSLTNVLLSGEHSTKNGAWEIDWKVSPTRSVIEDPDVRFTRYRDDDGSLSIGTESGLPERIWRFLNEDALVSKADVTHNLSLFQSDAKIKFGGILTSKERDYDIQSFQIVPQNVPLTGDPNEIFASENLWPTNESGTRGTRYDPQFLPNNFNKFNAASQTIGGYVSTELKFQKNLKTILGVRVEDYKQNYTGENQQRVLLDDERVIDDLDFFPSVNLIYSVKETQNIRLSYSKTVARPSFKEASFAEILDPLTGRTFIGGFFADRDLSGNLIWDGNLTSTRIDNFDLRWETFQKHGQTIAVSAFYKSFDRPIEIVQYVQAPNNFQPRNVGDGSVLGIEFEARQNLGFVSTALENFSLSGNVTYTSSSIRMSPTEFESRKLNAREGESIRNTRVMAGQAPYIINAGLGYKGANNGLELGLFYNVQGRTLQYVGVADKPDVFAVPFNSLNLNANKYFGEDEKIQIGLNFSNLLSAKREYVFESFDAPDEIFSSISPGTSISLKFGYKF